MPRTLTKVAQLPAQLAQSASSVHTEQVYRFQAPESYLALIDWADPDDPIRKLVIPDSRELTPVNSLDPTDEAHFTVTPGYSTSFRTRRY